MPDPDEEEDDDFVEEPANKKKMKYPLGPRVYNEDGTYSRGNASGKWWRIVLNMFVQSWKSSYVLLVETN